MLAAVRIAFLGAGAMGRAAARLAARRADVEPLVLDSDRSRAERVVAEIGRGQAREVDVEGGGLAAALKDAQAVAACLPYRLNLPVMEAALEARCPYADLGGLYHVTLRQLELDRRFREAGVPAVLGIGMAPGITNVLARLGADRLDEVDTVDLYNGSIERGGGFGVPYSPETILDEFTMPAMVYEEGQLTEVPAASGGVRFEFPEPIGELEAVYTLHSELATLPNTIQGVRNVRWRLALPPEVERGFRLLADLGLSSEQPVQTSTGAVTPRELLIGVLNRIAASNGSPRDIESTVACVIGTRGGRRATFIGTVIVEPPPEGITAGAFGTALPIAIAAPWLADGKVEPGVHPPETAFSAEEFLEAYAAEGPRVRISLEEELPGPSG
ncbi:MAG TPA: saccharopine dehydrogenase C-terminal domain-containing protein [Actinomycetota bacterium]|nr:saccharopine dehydrogenase C-terminal domain-containing protein [Actinomycetota bacterium]